jgi:L-rhamnose mutarotase
MKRYCLAIDLKDDQGLIDQYLAHHRNVWPENIQGIKDSGITVMDIYRTGNRMFSCSVKSPEYTRLRKL